jgi:hypothetical protein
MPWDEAWPQPSSEALRLIERIYRFANALNVLEINPGAARVAMLITLHEAFVLLDHLRGPWRMAVWAPSASSSPSIDLVSFDLSIKPQIGLKWGLLFGITLIIEDDTEERRL